MLSSVLPHHVPVRAEVRTVLTLLLSRLNRQVLTWSSQHHFPLAPAWPHTLACNKLNSLYTTVPDFLKQYIHSVVATINVH